MSNRAAQVERVEQLAEHHARSGKEPEAGGAVIEAMERYPDGDPQPDLLIMRYWMFYAAGVKHPTEAADVTVRRWREEKEA
jgi:hypothetical protein